MLTGKSHSVGKSTLANSQNHNKLVEEIFQIFLFILYSQKYQTLKKKRKPKHSNNKNQTNPPQKNQTQNKHQPKQNNPLPSNRYSRRTRPARGEKTRKFLQRLYTIEVHHCCLLLMSKGI